MEHDRAITGLKAVDFGQGHIVRAGDMFARMFVGVANVDQLRAVLYHALRFGRRYGCHRHRISPPGSRVDRAWRTASRSGGQRSGTRRSEEHTSELQSLMRISYA